ncbi:alpha/beta hydrolase-fold protein [soil metagenome]
MMALVGLAGPARAEGGAVSERSVASRHLSAPLRYQLYLPVGYDAGSQRYPVIYLLHGRGDNFKAWLKCAALLDALIAAGDIPPLIAVMPDAPSSQRGGYYVDAEPPGEPVESAFIDELLPHIDASLRTIAQRDGRVIGGYSMGGYGALRYALVYPALFASAIVLSPAVYTPLPPMGSSVREFGAFGRGSERFVDALYRSKNYPALLAGFAAQKLALRLFIVAGDDEYKNPNPAEAGNDIDLEAHLLFNRVSRVPGISAELRILNGGHDWAVWTPAFREGLIALVGKRQKLAGEHSLR